MILITGTKRSGTSMWMQILRAAGLPVFGTEFPKDWAEVIQAANPGGFFESPFRDGVYHATNPNPKTGAYLHPSETRSLVVKVFIPGLVRSDLAFVDRVVGTMRPFREYGASLARLYAMERANRPLPEGVPARVHVPPELEWWAENYSLVGDHLRRRYPLHLIAYDEVMEAPERVIPETLGWLGEGDVAAATTAVRGELRTQRDVAWEPEVVRDAETIAVFDELYARVRGRAVIDVAFIDRLNATNERLRPAIRDAMAAVRDNHRAMRRALGARRLSDRL